MKTFCRSALIALVAISSLTICPLAVSPAYAQAGQACTNGTNGIPVTFWSGNVLYGCPSGTQVWTAITTSVPTQTVSIPVTLSQLQTLNSVGIQLLPAQGTGTWVEIVSASLDLKYGSAAFTGGGTVTIGWGATSATTAAASTIAATVFTTFTASHTITVAGALAVTANTLIQNLPVWINAASADFAVGTGATGVIDVTYRVHQGF